MIIIHFEDGAKRKIAWTKIKPSLVRYSSSYYGADGYYNAGMSHTDTYNYHDFMQRIDDIKDIYKYTEYTD